MVQRIFAGRPSTKRYSKEKVRALLQTFEPLLTCILGDYQFDIYRLMRKHNGGNWADFRPFSNVMVRPSQFYATRIPNDQSGDCSGCITYSSSCSSPKAYAHQGRPIPQLVRASRSDNAMTAFSRWRAYWRRACRRSKRTNPQRSRPAGERRLLQ